MTRAGATRRLKGPAQNNEQRIRSGREEEESK